MQKDVFSMPNKEITKLIQKGIQEGEAIPDANSQLHWIGDGYGCVIEPISKKTTGKDLIGRTVFVLKFLVNGGGEEVSPGTIAVIKNVVRGKGITIETEKCPCCGQFSCITGVPRNWLAVAPQFADGTSKEDQLNILRSIWEAYTRHENLY